MWRCQASWANIRGARASAYGLVWCDEHGTAHDAPDELPENTDD